MSAKAQKTTTSLSEQTAKIIAAVVFAYILVRACVEFYTIAWGTGIWLGEFSLRWFLFFFGFVLFSTLAWVGAVLILWKPSVFGNLPLQIVSLRQGMKGFRWVFVVALLVFPVWFLQYTLWGVVFSGLYFRLNLWIYVVLGMALFLKPGDKLISWSSLLTALLLTSSFFSLAFAFISVSDYPFSIGWSEGNRLWDYSLYFGRHLYDYPADQDISATTDAGRQLVGGLPFLLPGVTIVTERFWTALTTVLPYLILGFAAFRFTAKDKILWILLGLWTFIFLKQGPIHPPLVLIAVMVALVWRRSLWISIPVIIIASFLAEESRYTWMFAPGMWIAMLEFSGRSSDNEPLRASVWWKTIILGLAGLFGGFFGGALLSWLGSLWGSLTSSTAGAPIAPSITPSISVDSVTSEASAHPLLWYRLLPSATSGMGILLLLLLAVGPTIILLVYLSKTKQWPLNTWQKAAILLPSMAFLVVGLIVSTKAGGGGDLHNLDMFLIGILFTVVIAWENGGRQWLSQIDTSPLWIKGTLSLLLILPGIYPLSVLRSFNYAEDIPWLVTLTDVSDGKFLEMFPPQNEVDDILDTIRKEIDVAKPKGEILFMDQRQLLTFGYVKDVKLVPEYEKKVLMNQAMADNKAYFEKLYADLADKRFSLIISEPLRAPVKDSGFEFGEESNAWVKWVVYPVLCYYEPVATFKSVQVELLVPRQGDVDCSFELPAELQE